MWAFFFRIGEMGGGAKEQELLALCLALKRKALQSHQQVSRTTASLGSPSLEYLVYKKAFISGLIGVSL